MVVAATAIGLSSGACTVVDEYEVAVKKSFTGNVSDDAIQQSIQFWLAPWNWGANFYKFPKREIQWPARGEASPIRILSKDQLEITVDGSIRYRIDPSRAVELFMEVGGPGAIHDYVYNVYRSSARDAISKFTADQIMSEERAAVDQHIEERIKEKLSGKGIALVDFFVRDIDPPATIKTAVEAKLRAQQEIQTEQNKVEIVQAMADQRRAEAKGIRDAQAIIAESLTPEYLQYEKIKALMAAATGENNTLIDVNSNITPMVAPRR